jgi:tetrahydromethanopterin S-methyltransferase subunit F
MTRGANQARLIGIVIGIVVLIVALLVKRLR